VGEPGQEILAECGLRNANELKSKVQGSRSNVQGTAPSWAGTFVHAYTRTQFVHSAESKLRNRQERRDPRIARREGEEGRLLKGRDLCYGIDSIRNRR